MPISLRLALRNWLARPLRPLLCSLAIAAAVALILTCGAAFDSIRYSFHTTVAQMLGVAEIHVRTAQRDTDARLPESMLATLRARPEIELADGRLQTHCALTKGTEHVWFDTVGVDPATDELLRPKVYTSGHPLTGDPSEVVVDAAIAERLHTFAGDSLEYTVDGVHTRTVHVAGVIKRPTIELIAQPTFYLPLPAILKDFSMQPAFDTIDIKLKDSANIEDLDAYAKTLAKDLGPSVSVTPGANSKARLASESRTIQLGLTLLSIVSGLCAALIIATTLSVGVQERIRQFGQLRCIGASRSQLATFLAADAFFMLAIGEVLGLALGYALGLLLIHQLPQFFVAFKLEPFSIFTAFLTGVAATAFGAAIPLYQVTRVSPMAAVTSVGVPPRRRHISLAAGLGLFSFCLIVLLWYIATSPNARVLTFTFAGIPLLFLGFTLLGPALLLLLERPASLFLGFFMRVRPALLRGAWSRTPWRAGAMVAALMIGVTLFTAVHARGRSVRASWSFPAKFPDLFLFSLRPMTDARLAALHAYPQVADLTPLGAFPVKLKGNQFKEGDFVPTAGANFVAVDPPSFARLIEMHFVEGDPATAIQQLSDGGHIFVTDEFRQAHDMGLNDKLTILSADGVPTPFTIAAVVSSTGMDLVKNYFDMRSTFRDTAVSTVMGSIGDARKYFRLKEPNLFLLNVTKAAQNPAVMGPLRDTFKKDDYESASSVDLKSSLNTLIDRLVGAMSLIATGALAVASLGVANMVIASVHARRFEFGVLRAIGAGRSQLIRLVLAEVSLIGLVAGILGSACGLTFAYACTLVDKTVGFPTRFLDIDPAAAAWYAFTFLALSTLLTIALAWLASLYPAIKGAFTAQRTLLAGGRA